MTHALNNVFEQVIEGLKRSFPNENSLLKLLYAGILTPLEISGYEESYSNYFHLMK